MYYHVIFFSFTPGVDDAQACGLLRELGELRAAIPQIVSYRFGRNDPENQHNKNMSHCFVMEFASRQDRYAYQYHPLHQAFIKDRLEPFLEDCVVVDFNDMDAFP